MPNWYDRPLFGPMSLRQVGRGLRESLVDPLARDEQALYAARHANPVADVVASLHPAYGVPAAIQDIAHGGNAVTEGAGAVPIVRGLRAAFGAAGELARHGVKGRRAAGNLVAGTTAITGINAGNRAGEIMNPGLPPDPYK